MKTIYELQQIANRLRQVTEVNSISPEDTFGLQSNILEYLADMEQNAEGLGIHKVYASYAAMVADASAPVGSNGKALRFGQLVVICNPSNTIQEENGNIYAWQKGNAGDAAWLLIGNLGSVLGNPQNGYYVCDTAAATAEKEITATGYVLSVGGSMKVKMANANTADNATLNINSTGVKALYYAGERASSINTWEAGETVEVYYDGTSYYANNVAVGSGSGDGAFDVSAKYPTSGVDGGNTYTLGGALAVLNASLSASKKKGGMSIKFIQSSDNKYVKFFCTADEFTTDVTKWQGVDDEPTFESGNLVKSGGVFNELFNRVEGNNKLDWSARLLKKYIDNHGVIVDNNSFCVSNAITVKKGDIIYFAQYSNKLDKHLTTSIEVCEFDSDNTFIKKTTVTHSSYDGEFLPCEITGDNTAYIRINFVPYATATDGVVFINEKLPYEPYIEPTDVPKYVSKEEAEEEKEQIIEMISNVEFEKHKQVNQYSPIFVDILNDALAKTGTGFFNLFDTSILNPNPKFDEVSEIDEEVVWHNNAWFKVSGIAGNDYVTFSEAGNADMSDIVVSDNWKGAVIQNANGDYVFCLAKYKDENSLYIYPSLTENLTNVEFGQKQSDDLHLTRRGYYAYAYALFNTNKKYCEKNLYIDKYRPTDEVNPFIPYGANNAYVTRMFIQAVNSYAGIPCSTVPAHTCLSFGSAINDTMLQNTPFGIKWNKNIKGYKGYVEVYIGGSCGVQRVNTGITRQSGEEIFIELWLDGVLSQRIEKDTNYVERICIDYKDAKEAELRIGANGLHSVDVPFIYIGAVTWWVSEMYFGSNANIFTDNSIVQAFDSWGVFDDGASFNKLKEYIDLATTMNNEMYNVSIGGTTSLYWKHWFSATIKPKQPSLVISDYGINDYKGPEYSGSVTAPDGKVYQNTNDKGDYVANMTHCIRLNMNHGFLPVVCSSGLSENGNINEWYQAVIDNLAWNVNL